METKRSEDGRASLVFSVRGPIPIQMGKIRHIYILQVEPLNS